MIIEPILLPSTLLPANAPDQGFWIDANVQSGHSAGSSSWQTVAYNATQQLSSAPANQLFLAELTLTPEWNHPLRGLNVQSLTQVPQSNGSILQWWNSNNGTRGMVGYSDFSVGAGIFANSGDPANSNTAALIDAQIWHPNSPWYAAKPTIQFWAQDVAQPSGNTIPANSLWRTNPYSVRYGVSFVDSQGYETAIKWTTASAYPYALGYLNVSSDTAARAAGRFIYRQFNGAPALQIAYVAGNSAANYQDEDLGVPWYSSPAYITSWAQNVTNSTINFPAGSPWLVNSAQVRYGVSFVDTNGVETAIAWMATGYYPFALASLTIPIDSTGRATARKIYRLFPGLTDVVMLGMVDDNTTTRYQDNAVS